MNPLGHQPLSPEDFEPARPTADPALRTATLAVPERSAELHRLIEERDDARRELAEAAGDRDYFAARLSDEIAARLEDGGTDRARARQVAESCVAFGLAASRDVRAALGTRDGG